MSCHTMNAIITNKRTNSGSLFWIDGVAIITDKRTQQSDNQFWMKNV